MIKRCLLAFGLTFSLAEASASAEDQRAERLVAALNLAEAGIATGSIAPLIVAREMLADLAPSGLAVKTLEAKWDSEARFLARGDPDILSRLSAITTAARDPDLLLVPAAPSVNLPEGVGLVGIAVAERGMLISVTARSPEPCISSSDPAIWVCDPDLARGEVLFEGQFGTGASYLVLTVEGGQ